ncbi:MAG: 4-phosphoerythronate dehydrogenase [Myxococcota bacterium]
MPDSEPQFVVDDAIPDAARALAGLGRVRALPGASIDAAAVAEADALVTRSVTRVDEALVRGSRLSVVATATAGIDHVDVGALQAAGIAFASSAGCNAQAVAEYVLAALLTLEAQGISTPRPLGIVGFGHVGRRVAALMRRHGVTVLACDPPLQRIRSEHDAPIDFDPTLDAAARREPLLPLEALRDACGTVSVHVPLDPAGPDRTLGLVDADFLAGLPAGAVVLNTCRGGVIDEPALLEWLAAGRGHAVLDVFAGEPYLDTVALLDRHRGAALVTPHVAGYTRQGKRAATAMALQAVASHFGRACPSLPPLPTSSVAAPAGPNPVRELLVAHAGLAHDDETLRDLATQPAAARGPAFEALRRGYRLRSEHAGTRVEGPVAAATAARLRDLGFQVPA